MWGFVVLVLTDLVQASLSATQDSNKDSTFGGLITPTSTISAGFMSSAMPGAGVFNTVGAQTQPTNMDKPSSTDRMDSANEITLQGTAGVHARSFLQLIDLTAITKLNA